MKKLVIIVFVVIILLFGGIITFMQQMEVGPCAKEESVDAVPTGDEGAASTASGNSETQLIDMEPITVPVFMGDSVQAPLRLQVRIGFKIDNQQNEGSELGTIEESQRRTERLEKYMPKLQDAFVVDLISYVPRLYRRNSKLDIQEIANRLREVGQRTIGKSRILSVEIKITEGETQAETQAPSEQ